MKFEDIKGLAKEELEKKIQEFKGELFEIKMKNSLGQLGNPLEVRQKRRDIARIKTALRQRG